MCGRYSLSAPLNQLQEIFHFSWDKDLAPRYNIAPSQQVLTVILENDVRVGKLMKWGLVPSWSKDSKVGANMINARVEGIANKPSYREPFKRQRCLILADGFYEWKKEGKVKQPVRFQLKRREPFAFAGLYDTWGKDDHLITTCTIITTEPNELLNDVHDRMPAILTPDTYNDWLNPKINDVDYVQSMIAPYSADVMEGYPVSDLINSPRYDLPEFLNPIKDNIQLSLF